MENQVILIPDTRNRINTCDEGPRCKVNDELEDLRNCEKHLSAAQKGATQFIIAQSDDVHPPKEPSGKQVAAVEAAAQGVLDSRAKYPDSSLADLYDPLTMPPELVKAHQGLNKVVDKCYRGKAFGSETERLEYLFGLYNEYVEPMIKAEAKKNIEERIN
ncbi:MAG: hypothetical protein KAJ52_00525 [Sedimentisphaerales bacterium]|nr:hypothetical protein [Sedimentisphaerales bacterium]